MDEIKVEEINSEAFIDDDGCYQFEDGHWYEVETEMSVVEQHKVVVH